MAKMLGNSPRGSYTCCKCRLCGRKSTEDPAYRRAQRHHERAQTRRQVSEETG